MTFFTAGTTIDDALVSWGAGLHVNIGEGVKGSGQTASISGQIATLRELFDRVNGTKAPFDGDDENEDLVWMVRWLVHWCL